MSLKRDDILRAEDSGLREVPVPEWGSTVWIRTLTGRERDRWELDLEAAGKDNARASLCALVICDEKGKSLFTAQDAAALGQKNAAALDRIFEAARELNLIGRDYQEATEKKSQAGPRLVSGTA